MRSIILSPETATIRLEKFGSEHYLYEIAVMLTTRYQLRCSVISNKLKTWNNSTITAIPRCIKIFETRKPNSY